MLKRALFFSCCLSVALCPGQEILAQSNATDSMQQLIRRTPISAPLQLRDTTYFRECYRLCRLYALSQETDSLFALSDRCLQQLSSLSAASIVTFSEKRVLQFKKKFVMVKGASYFKTNDYANALKSFQEYLVYAEKTGAVKDIGDAYNYMAYCHRGLEDYTQAYIYGNKAMSILKDSPHKSELGNAYNVVASYHSNQLQRYDSALYFVKRAIQLYEEDGQPLFVAGSLLDAAEYAYFAGQLDSCAVYLRQAAPYILEQQVPDQLVHYYTMLGRTEYAKGNNKPAMKHLLLAKELATQYENAEYTFNTNKYLTLVTAAHQQPLLALQLMEEMMDAYSEDVNLQKARELNTTQLNFEFERKQALADLELQKQKRIRDISLLGLILGCTVALLIFRLYRQSRKTARLLTEKNAQIEQSYRELKETQQQLVFTEKQREAQSVRVRIARDIHDELGSGLTKITLHSDFVRRKINGEQEEVRNHLQRIIENSKSVSASLNEIVWAVNPTHDTLESLVNYLKQYAGHYLEDMALHYRLHFPEIVPALAIHPEVKRNVLLVMKEALNNAVKYGQASLIQVIFDIQQETFRLTVQDNGVGFHPCEKNGSGNGLLNMKIRMDQIEGTLHISSAPEQGCTVVAAGTLTRD